MRKKYIQKGRGGKCSDKKPICIKINNAKQKALCNESIDEKSNVIKKIEHAFNVFKSKTPDDFDCIGIPERKRTGTNCFCTNFDFVWLTSINEAKNNIEEIKKNIDTSKVNEISMDEKQKFKTILLENNPLQFISDFLGKYISIANEKWNCTSSCSANANEVIAELNKTKEKFDLFYNLNKEEFDKIMNNISDEIDKEDTPESIDLREENMDEIIIFIKEQIPVLTDIFDIGKYILYDEAQIDNFTKKEIISKLDNINNLFSQDAGGKKKKTKKYKKKRKNRKYRTKKYKTRNGGKFFSNIHERIRQAGAILAVVGWTVLAVAAAGALTLMTGGIAGLVIFAVGAGMALTVGKPVNQTDNKGYLEQAAVNLERQERGWD